jgi:hypothetical protein
MAYYKAARLLKLAIKTAAITIISLILLFFVIMYEW